MKRASIPIPFLNLYRTCPGGCGMAADVTSHQGCSALVCAGLRPRLKAAAARPQQPVFVDIHALNAGSGAVARVPLPTLLQIL